MQNERQSLREAACNKRWVVGTTSHKFTRTSKRPPHSLGITWGANTGGMFQEEMRSVDLSISYWSKGTLPTCYLNITVRLTLLKLLGHRQSVTSRFPAMTAWFPSEECEPMQPWSQCHCRASTSTSSVTLYVCISQGLAGGADRGKLVKKYKKEVKSYHRLSETQ